MYLFWIHWPTRKCCSSVVDSQFLIFSTTVCCRAEERYGEVCFSLSERREETSWFRIGARNNKSADTDSNLCSNISSGVLYVQKEYVREVCAILWITTVWCHVILLQINCFLKVSSGCALYVTNWDSPQTPPATIKDLSPLGTEKPNRKLKSILCDTFLLVTLTSNWDRC